MGRWISPVTLDFDEPIHKFIFGEQSSEDFWALDAGDLRFEGDEGCIRRFTADDLPRLAKAYRQAKRAKETNKARMIKAIMKVLKEQLPESEHGWINLFAEY